MQLYQKINILLQNDLFKDISNQQLHILAIHSQQFHYKKRHLFYKQNDSPNFLFLNIKGQIALNQHYNGFIPYAKQSIIKIAQSCDLKNDINGISTNLYKKINKIIDIKQKKTHFNTQNQKVHKKLIRLIGPNQIFGDDGIFDEKDYRIYQCYALSSGFALKIQKKQIQKVVLDIEQQTQQQISDIQEKIPLSFTQLLDYHISQLDKIKPPKKQVKVIKKPKLLKNINFLSALYQNKQIKHHL